MHEETINYVACHRRRNNMLHEENIHTQQLKFIDDLNIPIRQHDHSVSHVQLFLQIHGPGSEN